MKTKKWFIVVSAFSSLLLTAVSGFAQGSLTPPGAPAPSMKTLAQIEPRTPISSLPFLITNSGSYYVTTNLTGTSGLNGIYINANNVTLDLNGFAMLGVSGAGYAVEVNGAYNNVTVRNGAIYNWGGGLESAYTTSRGQIIEGLKIYGSVSAGIIIQGISVIRDCVVVTNGTDGIYCGGFGGGGLIVGCMASGNLGRGIYLNNGVVLDSRVEYNTGDNIVVSDGSEVRGCATIGASSLFSSNVGIRGGQGCKIQDCVASGNSSGIVVGDGSSVTGCNAYKTSQTSGSGIQAGNYAVIKECTATTNYFGITAGSNSTIVACTVSKSASFGLSVSDNSNVRDCNVCNNGFAGVSVGNHSVVSGCVANGNYATGIDAVSSIRVTVTDCTVNQNGGNGVRVGGDSIVTGCHASANGTSGRAAGILTTSGAGSRVEGNQVRDNFGYGIQAGSSDLVVRNYAGNNSTNFIPSTGANFGPIQSASNMTNAMGNLVF